MRNANRGRLSKSFRCASEGLIYVLRQERNARLHLLAALLTILLGIWLDLSNTEWALISLAIAMVFVGEMFNTVVEVSIDMITVDEHPLAKVAKDVAAGAILLASLAAAIIGALIFVPHLREALA